MKHIAVLFSLLISVHSLSAQTSRIWTGSTSTNWNIASNWSPSGVPSSADYIVLNNGSLTNMPLLDANRSVTNITVSAGTLDLNGYTLTVTGTTSLTGGTINNGIAAFSNSTTAINGTTFGAKVTVTASTITFGNSTFNSKVVVTKTGSTTSTSNGNNIFNDTLEIRLQGGSITMYNSAADTYNGNIYVSNTSSGTLSFGNGNYAGTLAAGKKIFIGSAGFSSGNLSFKKFTQSGTTPQSITLGGTTSTLSLANGSTFNASLTIQAPLLDIGGSTFNKKLIATKTSTTINYLTGGNTFNDTVDIHLNAGSVFFSYYGNDSFNEHIIVSNISTGTLQIGGASSNHGTLASGKKIIIGNTGFSSGILALSGFIQNGTTDQSFTLTGTSSLNLSSCQFNARLDVTLPSFYIISGNTFNKKFSFIKNGTSNDEVSGGNTFNDTIDIKLQAGTLLMAHSYGDAYNGDIIVSNTGSGALKFGFQGSSTLASGKRIYVGSSGFASGILQLNLFTQNGTANQALTLTGTSTLQIGAGSQFNGQLTITTPSLSNLTSSTFNKKLLIIKNGTPADEVSGGNTFNDTVDIRLQSGSLLMATSYNDIYNGDIIICNTGTGTLRFGYLGSSTLSSGKKINVGSGGFASGILQINLFTQNGTTDQTIVLTGTAYLRLSNSQFNGRVTVTTPTVYDLTNNTFNKKLIITKSGSTTDTWGGGTFNDTTKIIVQSGTVYLNMYGNSTHSGDLYISNTGSGSINLGYNSYYAQFQNNKRVYIDGAGFSSGTLNINRILLHGTTKPLDLTTTGTALVTISGASTDTINVPVKLTSPGGLSVSGPTYNKKATFTVNGGTSQQWWYGPAKFNDTLDVHYSGSSTIVMAGYYPFTFNGPVLLSNTGGGIIKMGLASGNILSSNGSITVGSGGFASGVLNISNLTQTNSISQNIALTGTAGLTLNSTSWNAPVNFTSYTIASNTVTYKKKLTRNKTGGSSSTIDNFGYGCVFADTVVLNNQSDGVISFGGWLSAGDTIKGDVYLTGTNTANTINFNGPGGGSANYCTLVSGKRIIVDSTTYKGTLAFSRFQQLGSTAQSIVLGKTSTITFASSSIFNGACTFRAGNIIAGSTTFNGTLAVTKTSSSTNTWSTANTYNGDVSITNTGSGYINASYVASGGDTYNANATFTKSGTGDVIIAGNASTVTFKGNVTLNNISSTQFTGSQVALFTGTSSQTLSQSGGNLNFGRVTINKASNNLTLSSPLTVSTALTLTSGKILTTSTNLLNLADNATVSGASNSSYVEGPMSKTGNDAFTFPTGLAGVYRPLGISAPSSTATVFTAEYKNTGQALGSTLSSPLTRISNCEYWTLARSGTSSNAAVTLNWGTGSCETANPSVMKVASWNGSHWIDAGNTSNTGTNTAGSVTSSSLSSFNAFTTSNGCTNTVSITTSPTSVANVCPGTTVTLTSSSATSYLWSTSATTQAISPTTGNTYTVTALDANNCAATASRVVGFSTITAAITASPGTPINICEGTTVSLTSNTASSYFWSPGGANTQTINPTTDNTYTLTTYDGLGCSATANIEVSFHLKPVPPTTPAGTSERCRGLGTDSYTTETDNYNTVEWTLQPESAGTITYSGESVSVDWDAGYTGTATLTVHAENSCGFREAHITIDVNNPMVYYADFDGDGLGNPMVSTTTCPQPDGYVPSGAGFDCDDNTADVE